MMCPHLSYRTLPVVIGAMLAAGAGAAAQQTPAPDTIPLVVGVVRGDGVLLPIALLQDGGWTETRVFDGTIDPWTVPHPQ